LKKYLQWRLWNIRLKSRSGGSLIELLIVISAVLLLGTICTYTMLLLQRFVVRAELMALYMTCRYAQQVAVAANRTQYIVCDTENASYTYNSVRHMLRKGAVYGYPANTKGPPACPEGNLTKSVTFMHDTIVFQPTGTISSGAIYITDNKNTCCYALSSGVSSVSCLHCYEYRKGIWSII
jgi:type II secretory pathway pseudopilin PulG